MKIINDQYIWEVGDFAIIKDDGYCLYENRPRKGSIVLIERIEIADNRVVGYEFIDIQSNRWYCLSFRLKPLFPIPLKDNKVNLSLKRKERYLYPGDFIKVLPETRSAHNFPVGSTAYYNGDTPICLGLHPPWRQIEFIGLPVRPDMHPDNLFSRTQYLFLGEFKTFFK